MESPTTYRVAYVVMVIAWAAFWPVVGYSYHDSNKRQGGGRGVRIPLINRFLLAAVFLASCICLASPRWDSRLLWMTAPALTAVGVLLMLLFLGIAFKAARLLAWQPVPLGDRRAQVFASGPYGWVRHPTYVCITAAMWVTALLLARRLGLYAAGVLTAAHLALILMEERSTRQVDPMAYDAYAARVPMLVPWPLRRAPQSATASEGSQATAEALFAEASPVLSPRAARQAAKAAKAAGADGDAGKTAKGKGQGKGQNKRRQQAGQEQSQPSGDQPAQSRAWQFLDGKQD